MGRSSPRGGLPEGASISGTSRPASGFIPGRSKHARAELRALTPARMAPPWSSHWPMAPAGAGISRPGRSAPSPSRSWRSPPTLPSPRRGCPSRTPPAWPPSREMAESKAIVRATPARRSSGPTGPSATTTSTPRARSSGSTARRATCAARSRSPSPTCSAWRFLLRPVHRRRHLVRDVSPGAGDHPHLPAAGQAGDPDDRAAMCLDQRSLLHARWQADRRGSAGHVDRDLEFAPDGLTRDRPPGPDPSRRLPTSASASSAGTLFF